MRKLYTLLAGLILLPASGAATATVLTFDDLTPCTGLCGSLNTVVYGGLRWWNIEYEHSSSRNPSGDTGFNYGTVSGEYVAFNTVGWDATVRGYESFDFNGVYLTGGWRDNLNIEVTGLDNEGTTLYSQTVTAAFDTATWFQFDFFGIDRLEFHAFGGTQVTGMPADASIFAMDDFTFNESDPEPEPEPEPEPQPVPEAPSLVLLGLALAGFGGMRKLRRKADA